MEKDVILEKKLEDMRYSGTDLQNFKAEGELMVTITLAEYRNLVSEVANKKKDIDTANEGKYQREVEIKTVKEANDKLKSENYDLKREVDDLKKLLEEAESKIPKDPF